MELFRLFGSIFIEDKDAISALNKTNKKAETTADKFKRMAGGAAKVGAAALSMGAVAAAGLTKIATNTSEAGDRIDKMSQKMGLSRESFQEWDYIMSQNGLTIDSMQTGFRTLTNQFDDLKRGSATAQRAFGGLGLSLEDLEGLSQEEIFNKTISALQNMEDETQRAAIANDLFGRSGAELAPLLNQSSESIEALRKNAHEMGMVLSDEAVDGAVKLTDTMDTLKRAGAGLMNQLGSALMPVLQKVLDVVIDNMPVIQNLISRLTPILASVFDKLLPPLMDLVEALLPPILELIEQIMPVLGELMDAIMPVIIDLLNMLLPPVIEIVRKLLPVLLAVLKPLLPLLEPLLKILQPFIDLLMMIIDPLIEILDMILPPLATLLSQYFNWYLPKLTKAFSFVADVLGGAFKSAFEAIRPIIQTAKDLFNNLISFIKNVFTGNWKGAWQNIVNHFKLVWNGMKAIFKAPINWIIDGLNRFIYGVNRIKIPNWVPGIGGKGLNIQSIPRLKVGIDYVPYDDFPALLHKGERVLTAEENERGVAGSSRMTVEIPVVLDGKEIARLIAPRLDEELERTRTRKGRAYA